MVLALHACDTATDDALARADRVGGPRWCSPRRAATTTWPPSCARRPPRRRTPCSPGTASCASASPTPSPTPLRAAILRQAGYRVDVVEFVESEHTPRNTLLRATRTGGPVTGGTVRQEYDDLVSTWGVHPHLAELLGSGWRERAGWAPSPRAPRCSLRHRPGRAARQPVDGRAMFSFADPEIVESSGLVAADDRVWTVNDSGDIGRVFTVDTGHRPDRRRHLLGRRTRSTSRRWRPPGPGPSGWATSATTSATATPSR